MSNSIFMALSVLAVGLCLSLEEIERMDYGMNLDGQLRNRSINKTQIHIYDIIILTKKLAGGDNRIISKYYELNPCCWYVLMCLCFFSYQ